MERKGGQALEGAAQGGDEDPISGGVQRVDTSRDVGLNALGWLIRGVIGHTLDSILLESFPC